MPIDDPTLESHLKLLGLTRPVTIEAVEAALQERRFIVHPDRQPDKRKAAAGDFFKHLGAIADEVKERIRYDAAQETAPKPSPKAAAPAPKAAAPAPAPAKKPSSWWDDLPEPAAKPFPWWDDLQPTKPVAPWIDDLDSDPDPGPQPAEASVDAVGAETEVDRIVRTYPSMDLFQRMSVILLYSNEPRVTRIINETSIAELGRMNDDSRR